MIKYTREQLEIILNIDTSNIKGKFEGIEFDHRLIKGGELFIGLAGATQHGQTYANQALDRGASLVLVEDPDLIKLDKDRIIVVPDTLLAFQELAKNWKNKLKTKTIGITGSVGKTTIKEMCACILMGESRGNYSLKSYNNHVGVPYTLSKINPEHNWNVIEIGMNKSGEIRKLSKLVQPDLSIICEVSYAHTEFFNSLEEIAKAKFEIVENTKDTLIYNSDNSIIRDFAKNINLKSLSYGFSGTDLKLIKVENNGLLGIKFEFEFDKIIYSTNLKVLGKHNALNACAAILASKQLFTDLTIDSILKNLSNFQSPYMRLQHIRLRNGLEVIDDSYNASYMSMVALLDLAGTLEQKVGLILGDMLELGEQSDEIHQKVAKKVGELKPEFLIYVGKNYPLFETHAKINNIKVFSATNFQVAYNLFCKLKCEVLMVKASRGIQLDQTVKLLIDHFGME